jgi:hypothetical protein
MLKAPRKVLLKGWNGLTSPEYGFQQPDNNENDCDNKCYMDQTAQTKDE